MQRQPSDSNDDIEKKRFQEFNNRSVEEKYSIENFERLMYNVEQQETKIREITQKYE